MSADYSDLFEGIKPDKASLIALLQQVQKKFGYISREAVSEISRLTKLTESYIFGVASFYSQFSFTPRGRHTIKVCLGTACHVRGGQSIFDEISRYLGAEAGGTTSDNRYTLDRVACFGSCALAPVMVVDNDVYGRMTVPRAKELIGKYE
jgi:NADH-quinone oxidoreductase subunit E